MCGIAGLVYQRGAQHDALIAVRRMIALQRHRGPDGEGFYDTPGASLGHCRLAIIDLSDAGHQPMRDPSGRYCLTYNGEIYNYLELANELRALGHCFRSHSDTEVLLTAYRQWGAACLARLRGMFAFAIWDEQERRLFAARDRLGIKPFHYWTDSQGRLAFASEIKALLAFVPTVRVNRRLAQAFLAWGLLDHEAAETMFEDIWRLPPGHSLTWEPDRGLSLQRYWHLEVTNDLETPPVRRAALIAEFRARFEESMALHLRSDVPVGTCLSGGLDSSSIVCTASAELHRRGIWREDWQHTFSACFDDPRLDERPYIAVVAEATGCQTHFVFPRGEWLQRDLHALLWHQEEPVGGFSVYSQYCVARLAREQGLKVLLDGQGADEQLAGYRKFILVYIRQLLRARCYLRALHETFAFVTSPAILRTSSLVDGRRYLFRSAPELAQLWPADTLPERPATLGLGDGLGRRIEADLLQFSLPSLLRYEDRNTMAFGIESRVPFVDHVLVEWLATLPADMRLRGGWTKYILRQALADVLPAKIRARKSKLGFATPDSAWLAGPLAEWLHSTLRVPQYLNDVVDMRGVHHLLTQHLAGQRSLAVETLLLRLALYETWAQIFLSPDGWACPHQTTGTVLQQAPVRVGSAAVSANGMDTTL
jgi:asparagine synthase (glutamine-hydrolysing)